MPGPLDRRAPSGFGYPFTIDPGTIRGTDNQAVAAANGAVYLRCRDGGPISKIGLEVVVQSGNISLAAFQNSGVGRSAVPGDRLATSGAVACPAAGYQEIALDAAIRMEPGDWLALSADNTTATFRANLNSTAAANLGLGRAFKATTAHPLPNPAANLAVVSGVTIVLIGVP